MPRPGTSSNPHLRTATIPVDDESDRDEDVLENEVSENELLAIHGEFARHLEGVARHQDTAEAHYNNLCSKYIKAGAQRRIHTRFPLWLLSVSDPHHVACFLGARTDPVETGRRPITSRSSLHKIANLACLRSPYLLVLFFGHWILHSKACETIVLAYLVDAIDNNSDDDIDNDSPDYPNKPSKAFLRLYNGVLLKYCYRHGFRLKLPFHGVIDDKKPFTVQDFRQFVQDEDRARQPSSPPRTPEQPRHEPPHDSPPYATSSVSPSTRSHPVVTHSSPDPEPSLLFETGLPSNPAPSPGPNPGSSPSLGIHPSTSPSLLSFDTPARVNANLDGGNSEFHLTLEDLHQEENEASFTQSHGAASGMSSVPGYITVQGTSSHSPAPITPLQDYIANLEKDQSLPLLTAGKSPSSKRKQLDSDRDSSHHTPDQDTPVTTPITNSKRRRRAEESNHKASKAITLAPEPAMTSKSGRVRSDGKLSLTEEDLISYTRYVVAHSRHHDFLQLSDASGPGISLQEAVRHTEQPNLPRTTYTHLATVLCFNEDWAFIEVNVSSHTISVWPIPSPNSDLSQDASRYLEICLNGVSQPHEDNTGHTSNSEITEGAPGAAYAADKWKIIKKSCPFSDWNNTDSGIIACVVATYRIAKCHTPPRVDTHLWRCYLYRLIKLCEPHCRSDSDDHGRPPFLAQSEDLRHISDPSLDVVFSPSDSPGSILSISGKGLRELIAHYCESLTTRQTQVESLLDELHEMQRPLSVLQVLRKQEAAFLETDSLLAHARGNLAQQMLSEFTSMFAQQHDPAESVAPLLRQIARHQEHNGTTQSHRNMHSSRLGLLQALAQKSNSMDMEVDKACEYLENLRLKLLKELTEEGLFMLPWQKGKELLHV